MQFLHANHLTLNCVISGNPAGEPLLFINSLGTDLRIWDAVVPHFETDYRVVRYDKRGHGLSDCPAAPYSMRDHALDLVGVLDALDIAQVTLVGISVGGMIAQYVAAAWPERLHQLVLCDTAAKIGTATMWNERINTLRLKGMDALADSILSRWFAPGFATRHPAAYAGYRNMLTRTPVAGYTGTCAALRDADLTAQTRTIQASTLVLCGAEDVATTPEMGQNLAALLPHGRYVEIAQAGHLPCVEQPQAMAVQVKRFLRSNVTEGA